jgi:hypothetical protein
VHCSDLIDTIITQYYETRAYAGITAIIFALGVNGKPQQ